MYDSNAFEGGRYDGPAVSGTRSTKVNWQYLGKCDPVRKAAELVSAGRTVERLEKERDWWINWHWFRGLPWFMRNTSTGKIDQIPENERRYAQSWNMILPRIRTLIGNETYVPKFRARNASAMGSEDQMRVRGVEDVANHCTRAGQLSRKKRRADLYKHLFSLCWFKIGWDPTKGPISAVQGQVPCPTCNGTAMITGFDGNPAACLMCSAQGLINGTRPGMIPGIVGSRPEGEIAIDVCPPWEVICDTSARDMFDIRWAVHERQMDRAYAFELFAADTGLKLDDLPRGNKVSTDMSNFMSAVDGRRVGSSQDVVTVRELWHLPTPEYPKGIYAVIIGNITVRGGPNPWEHGKIPFVPYRCYEDPAQFYPRSTADELVPINAQFNEMMSKYSEHVDMGLIMRLLVARDQGIDFDDVPGVVRFDYKPGRPKPEFLRDSGVTPDFSNWIAMAKSSADDMSAVSDVMRGQMASNEPNAQYSAFIEERTKTPLRMMYEDNQDSLTEVARLAVDTAKLMYRNGRLLRDVFGPGGSVMMRMFMLEQVGSSSDVEIIPERDVGRSLASRRAEIIEAYKAGVMNNPRLMKLMEYATDDEIYDDMILNESVAQIDVEKVEKWDPATQPPPPVRARLWNNHPVFIRVKERALNQMRLSYNPDDPRCQFLEQNILEHQALAATQAQMIAGKQMEQAAQFGLANAAMPGVPGPDGGPGAPAGAGAEGAVTPPMPGPVGTQPTLDAASASLQQTAPQGGVNVQPAQ